ncbi:MAG: SDR family oxidoreductase [Methylocystaceae bacterium]|nr:SDR family oxidoreductase [Methylocystaceae bacterium]
MPKLSNKVALITGSSRGLGRETALRMAQEGCDIIVCYRKENDEADKVVQEIKALGAKATALQVDLNGTTDLKRFIDEVEKALGQFDHKTGLDFLINNAGVERKAAFGNFSDEDFDLIFNTNIKAPFFLTQGLLPFMNDNGRIIMIGTGLTRFSYDFYIAYAASKAALTTTATYLAKILGPRGITVNTVAPGALDTDFTKAFFDENPEVVKSIADSTALGRIGLPEDVTGIITFLCTQEGAWINGQRIEVSGGIHL